MAARSGAQRDSRARIPRGDRVRFVGEDGEGDIVGGMLDHPQVACMSLSVGKVKKHGSKCFGSANYLFPAFSKQMKKLALTWK